MISLMISTALVVVIALATIHLIVDGHKEVVVAPRQSRGPILQMTM
jgi:hypothetical protein